MPLSPVFPPDTPLEQIRTYDGQTPFANGPGNHVHIHLEDLDPPPRKTRARDSVALGDVIEARARAAAMRRRTRDEEEPLATASPGEIVAKLPPLQPGTHYEIELREEGYIVLVEEGEPLGPYDLPEDRVGDRLSYGPGGNPKLRRMNDAARKFWRNGARTTDAVEHQVLTWRTGPGERLELRGPTGDGNYEVILIGPDRDISGRTPLGGAGDGPLLRSKGATTPSRTSDKLRAMNKAASKFWNTRR